MLIRKSILTFGIIASCTYLLAESKDIENRKIGIFSGGLLASHPESLKIQAPFKKSTLTMPTQLGRIFGKGTPNQRLNRIYDKDFGVPIHVWQATSKYTLLPQAIQNLADRKGTTKNKIFYIKTLLRDTHPNMTEKPILDKNGNIIKDNIGNPWYIHEGKHNPMSIQDQISLAKWASGQGYSAVLWTGFGKNAGHGYEQLKNLLHDKTTLNNTKKYIKNLPDQNELTAFEKNIVTGQLD